MARPTKEGLEYFPFDVDFFEDEKIEAIAGEFGIKGEIATIKLLCAIYRNGYYILWNDLLKMKLLKRLPGVSSDLLEQVVTRLILWEFFDKHLFDSANVLTSRGIQKRYAEAISRRKTANNSAFWLLNGVNVYINPTSPELLPSLTTQSKVKESKGEESKVNQFPSFENFSEVLSESDKQKAIEVYKIRKHVLLTSDQVDEMFKAFKIQNLTGKKFYQSGEEVISHFKNWLPMQKIEAVKIESTSYNAADQFKNLLKQKA